MNSTTIDVAGTGFAVLDRIYEAGRKTAEALGGSCANVLWSLAMLDRRVVPILSLGNDKVGASLVEEFKSAGADTRYISRRCDLLSPILVQHLDRIAARHHFVSICPETKERLPRYTAVRDTDVTAARTIVGACRVFYSDRLNESIVQAMEGTAFAGGVVFFEPSRIDDQALFERALKVTSILKYSSDRIDARLAERCSNGDIYSIVTLGAGGLELRHGGRCLRSPAAPVRKLVDTCGAGDMVTVGVVDRLLQATTKAAALDFGAMIEGARAGQRLAALNCAYVGARGVFQGAGRDGARHALAAT